MTPGGTQRATRGHADHPRTADHSRTRRGPRHAHRGTRDGTRAGPSRATGGQEARRTSGGQGAELVCYPANTPDGSAAISSGRRSRASRHGSRCRHRCSPGGGTRRATSRTFRRVRRRSAGGALGPLARGRPGFGAGAARCVPPDGQPRASRFVRFPALPSGFGSRVPGCRGKWHAACHLRDALFWALLSLRKTQVWRSARRRGGWHAGRLLRADRQVVSGPVVGGSGTRRATRPTPHQALPRVRRPLAVGRWGRARPRLPGGWHAACHLTDDPDPSVSLSLPASMPLRPRRSRGEVARGVPPHRYSRVPSAIPTGARASDRGVKRLGHPGPERRPTTAAPGGTRRATPTCRTRGVVAALGRSSFPRYPASSSSILPLRRIFRRRMSATGDAALVRVGTSIKQSPHLPASTSHTGGVSARAYSVVADVCAAEVARCVPPPPADHEPAMAPARRDDGCGAVQCRWHLSMTSGALEGVGRRPSSGTRRATSPRPPEAGNRRTRAEARPKQEHRGRPSGGTPRATSRGDLNSGTGERDQRAGLKQDDRGRPVGGTLRATYPADPDPGTGGPSRRTEPVGRARDIRRVARGVPLRSA